MGIAFDTGFSANLARLEEKLPEIANFVNHSLDVVRSFAATEVNTVTRQAEEAAQAMGAGESGSPMPASEPLDPAIGETFVHRLSEGYTALANKVGHWVGDTAQLLAWGAAHHIEQEAHRIVEHPLPPGFPCRLQPPPRDLPGPVPLPSFGPGIARSIERLGDKLTGSEAVAVAYDQMPVHFIDGLAHHWDACAQDKPGTQCGASWGGLIGTAAFVGSLSPRALAAEFPATAPMVVPMPRPAVIELPAVETAAQPWSLQPAFADAYARGTPLPRQWNQMSSGPFDKHAPAGLDGLIEAGLEAWNTRAAGKAVGELSELREAFLEKQGARHSASSSGAANAQGVVAESLRYLRKIRETIEENKATPEYVESQAILAEMRIARAQKQFTEAATQDVQQLNAQVDGIVEEFHARLDDAVLRKEPGDAYVPLSRATENPALQATPEALPKADVAKMAEQIAELAKREKFLKDIAEEFDRFGKKHPGNPAQNLINVARETGMQGRTVHAQYLEEINVARNKLTTLDEQVAQTPDLADLQELLAERNDVLMQIEADMQVLKRRSPKDASEDAIEGREIDSEQLRELQARRDGVSNNINELTDKLSELKSPLEAEITQARTDFASGVKAAREQLDELVQGLLNATRYPTTPRDVATAIRADFEKSGIGQ